MIATRNQTTHLAPSFLISMINILLTHIVSMLKGPIYSSKYLWIVAHIHVYESFKLPNCCCLSHPLTCFCSHATVAWAMHPLICFCLHITVTWDTHSPLPALLCLCTAVTWPTYANHTVTWVIHSPIPALLLTGPPTQVPPALLVLEPPTQLLSLVNHMAWWGPIKIRIKCI